MTDVVSYPPIPFWHGIPGGLRPGKMVEVRGTIPYGCESFHINFTDGVDTGSRNADRIFHISVRPPQKVVVRNTMRNGSWETEERSGGFPFASGKQFIMLILVEGASYKIAVNGQHHYEFFHRHAVDRASMLYVDGSVRIEEVRIFEKQPPVPCIPAVPCAQSLTINSPVPCTLDFPAPLETGGVIEIAGFVPQNAEIFQINFLSEPKSGSVQSDCLLHLSIRFKYSVVIRNTMKNDEWEQEEGRGPFPFKRGNPFLMRILADKQCYRISVDNFHCWEFRHRISMFLASKVYIDGTVVIDRVNMMPSRSQFEGPKPELESRVGITTHLPIINPVVPYHYNIHEGLQKGLVIYISGHPTENCERFTINLVCDDTPQEDIAFHFDARLYCRTVVRNTMLNGHWLVEETISPYFPFAPCQPFDMLIRVDDDKYLIALNGQHFTYYQHRIINLEKINKLHIVEGINVSCIRFRML